MQSIVKQKIKPEYNIYTYIYIYIYIYTYAETVLKISSGETQGEFYMQAKGVI
jgi:hypothetical protein